MKYFVLIHLLCRATSWLMRQCTDEMIGRYNVDSRKQKKQIIQNCLSKNRDLRIASDNLFLYALVD